MTGYFLMLMVWTSSTAPPTMLDIDFKDRHSCEKVAGQILEQHKGDFRRITATCYERFR